MSGKEKRFRERGRPRTKPYYDIGDFLSESEEIKKDWLFRKIIIETLEKRRWRQLEEIDNIVYVDTPGVSPDPNRDPDLIKPIIRAGPRWKFQGETFRCATCQKTSRGSDFTIDEDHDPPRIRWTLECGHRQETEIITHRPHECPACGGEIQPDVEGLLFCLLCTWKEEESVLKKGPVGELTKEEKKLLRKLK